MNTEVKNIDTTKKELLISVEGDIVKNKFEDAFREIEKYAKVKGFRQGHLPRNILEKEFVSVARQQVLKELIPELYSQTLKKEDLYVIDAPEITDIKLDRIRLSFRARVEILPELAVKNYKGLKITYKKINVSTDEIRRNLDSFKETRKIDILDDNYVKSLGYPNLDELESSIARQIAVQKNNTQQYELREQINEQLTKDLDFKLPPSLVKRELDELLRQLKAELLLQGISKEKIAEQENEYLRELEPHARKRVKIYLILSEIAKRENIPLDEQMSHKVMEFLLREADWQEIS